MRDDRQDWLVAKWPHSRSLGERWFAMPPTTPPHLPWPGTKWFDTKDEAHAYVESLRSGE